MVFKQHKGQTFFLALIGLAASVGLLAIVIFDLRKLPHEEHFLLDTPILYWVFKGFCLLCFCFCAVGDIYLFRQLFSKAPLAEICDQYFMTIPPRSLWAGSPGRICRESTPRERF